MYNDPLLLFVELLGYQLSITCISFQYILNFQPHSDMLLCLHMLFCSSLQLLVCFYDLLSKYDTLNFLVSFSFLDPGLASVSTSK